MFLSRMWMPNLRREAAWAILIACLLLGTTFTYFLYFGQGIEISQAWSGTPRSQEAYVTFLSSTEEPWYLDSVRLLLFQLKYDPLTLDPSQRDFVVLTTPYVPANVEDQLRSEGALVLRHDLITEGLPRGGNQDGYYDEQPNHHYRDQYTKLAIFNMTSYERLIYIDADVLLVKPIHELWKDPNANPADGVAGFSDPGAGPHPIPIPDGNLLNAGFLLVRPSHELCAALLQETDFVPTDMEQSLLNHHFRRDGPTPWLPLNHIFTSVHPGRADLEGGVHSLHEKMWRHNVDGLQIDRELTELWHERLGRMEGFWINKMGGV